jgi:hexosaminidase
MVIAGGPPFEIARTTGVYVDGSNPEVTSIGEVLAAQLRRPTGFPIAVSPLGTPSAASIILRLVSDRTALGEEGYELSVTKDSVRLVANRPAGLFRGIQTIRQLLPADIESDMGVERYDWSIPALTITDQPRFAYRGAMLDVSRHFFTVDEVEQYLDILALYKLNVLHLHLSDDQGFRIQIDSRPKLTSMGSQTQVGGGPGGFFTKHQCGPDRLPGDLMRTAAARSLYRNRSRLELALRGQGRNLRLR